MAIDLRGWRSKLGGILLPAVDDDSQNGGCEHSSYNLNYNHNYPPFPSNLGFSEFSRIE
jgi:hypothetical protein